MSFFFENPGLAHIGHRILTNLDFDTQLACRLVHRSMKYLLEDPILNQKEIKYWLNECINLNFFSNIPDATDVVVKWKNFIKLLLSKNKQTTLKFHLERKSKSGSHFKLIQSTPILFFKDDLNILKFIVENIQSEYSVFDPLDKYDENILHQAAGDGFIEIVKILKPYFHPQKPDLELKSCLERCPWGQFGRTPII